MSFDKKAYDREYQRKRAEKVYADFYERRLKVFEVLGGECFMCKALAKKGFHLHHNEYHPTESNYPRTSKSMSVRLKRLKEAELHPERFTLLCSKCHRLLEMVKFLLNKNKVDFNRLKTLLGIKDSL